MRSLDVGVVGAGTAGPAAALFLARSGHRVKVYEAASELGPVGATIVLQPTGLYALERLGLRDEVVARSARLSGLRCKTTSGRTIVDLAYEELGEGLCGLGTHRGTLFLALHRALTRERIPIEIDCALASLRSEPRGRVTVIDERGEARGTHDLVVVADGARSRVRRHAGIASREERYPWGALWFVGRDDRASSSAARVEQIVERTDRMVGLLPCGVGPSNPLDGERLVTLFYSIREAAVPEFRGAGLGAFRDEVRRINPAAETLVDQIRSLDEVRFTPYWDVTMSHWASRNVAVIGDAAHAMSPQLGQGANLALFDAMSLAQSLEHEEDLGVALERYNRSRRAHLEYYQFATRALTPFFQSDATWIAPFRDLGFAAMLRVGPLRRTMTRAMAGALTGPFAGFDLATLADN